MDSLKAQGNEAFKKGDFAQAASFYQQAIDAVEAAAHAAFSEEDKQGIQKEAASLHSNLSCALLKLGNSSQALEQAEKCTQVKPEWHKGWFRKGEAHFALGEYEKAELAYKKALDLSGGEDMALKKCLMLALEAQQGFFFRQLSPGREFCAGAGSNMVESQIFRSAQQMRNFIYLVGDAKTREVVVVDAAWDVNGILAFAEAERVKLVGAVVTHYHFDHTGGMPPPPFDVLGITVPGIKDLAVKHKLPVHVHREDAAVLRQKNGVPSACIKELSDNSILRVGGVTLRFVHTPGHTPGSQCIFIERASGHEDGLLISGDTLFIGSCGRLDLPDCDARAMRESLQSKLAHLPDQTRVYPGHDYGGSFTTIGREKKTGLLKQMSEQEWMRMHPRK